MGDVNKQPPNHTVWDLTSLHALSHGERPPDKRAVFERGSTSRRMEGSEQLSAPRKTCLGDQRAGNTEYEHAQANHFKDKVLASQLRYALRIAVQGAPGRYQAILRVHSCTGSPFSNLRNRGRAVLAFPSERGAHFDPKFTVIFGSQTFRSVACLGGREAVSHTARRRFEEEHLLSRRIVSMVPLALPRGVLDLSNLYSAQSQPSSFWFPSTSSHQSQ